MEKQKLIGENPAGAGAQRQGNSGTVGVSVVQYVLEQIQMVPLEKLARMSKIHAGLSLLLAGMSDDVDGDFSKFAERFISAFLVGTAQANSDKADGTQLSTNHERNQRIYELSLNPDLTWGMIASAVNQEFEDEQLCPDSASTAAKRYQAANKLPAIPRRNPGRKPKGRSE